MHIEWVDEPMAGKLGGVPIRPGSQQYVDLPLPGPAQAVYVDGKMSGRVFPFNNGGGWEWASVANCDPEHTPTRNFPDLTPAKVYVEFRVLLNLLVDKAAEFHYALEAVRTRAASV